MEILKIPTSLILTQRKYVMDLLHEFQCDSLLVTTCPLGPLSKSSHSSSSNDTHLDDVSFYEKLVDKLNYRTNTRPDIAFVV